MANFTEYARKYEYQVLLYSIFTTVLSLYFIYTLFSPVFINLTFTILIGVFLVIVSVAGFYSVFSKNSQFKIFVSCFILKIKDKSNLKI